MLGVSEDGVPPVHLLHYFWVHTVLLKEGDGAFELVFFTISFKRFPGACFYLNVSDELQSGSFYRGLAVDDPLYCSCPPHGLIQHLSIKAVGMLPAIHYDVPVAC